MKTLNITEFKSTLMSSEEEIQNVVDTFVSNEELNVKLTALIEKYGEDISSDIERIIVLSSIPLMDMIHTSDFLIMMNSEYNRSKMNPQLRSALIDAITARSNENVRGRLSEHTLEALTATPKNEESIVGLLLLPLLRGDATEETIRTINASPNKPMIKIWNTLTKGALGHPVTKEDVELVYA